MKNLLYKEYKLFVIPLVYLFTAFALMLIIPNYPYTVSFFYTGLGIFFCMQTGRENKDINYMLMLPIAKKEIVKARYLTVISIELIQMIICIPFSILRGKVLTYPNEAGIEADVAMYGGAFLIFTVFNGCYFATYFKNVSKVGAAFIKASIATFVTLGIVESSVHIGKAVFGTCFWDSMERTDQIKQLPILLVGMIVFVVVMYMRYQADAKHFEAQDF